ncbi:MAG: rhodanese-like domain-containing protein [Methyloglobulus sp.]|nr:rhodanese-like domain-containing protein [Pseudomonadota bacterium]MSS76246.1 rhodanese-like domain-containing protein [Methyloglobulus sp.]
MPLSETFTSERFIEFILNHYILALALVVVTYLLIQELFDSALKKFGFVSPLLAVTKMNNGNTVVIDVREPDEFNKGHIDSAVNLPLSKIKEQISSFDAYKNNQVLIVCQDGTRSATTGKIITKAGHKDVFVITGGMQSWQEDYKLPIKVNRKK